MAINVPPPPTPEEVVQTVEDTGAQVVDDVQGAGETLVDRMEEATPPPPPPPADQTASGTGGQDSPAETVDYSRVDVGEAAGTAVETGLIGMGVPASIGDVVGASVQEAVQEAADLGADVAGTVQATNEAGMANYADLIAQDQEAAQEVADAAQAFPDMGVTPSPAGPIPVPYPNLPAPNLSPDVPDLGAGQEALADFGAGVTAAVAPADDAGQDAFGFASGAISSAPGMSETAAEEAKTDYKEAKTDYKEAYRSAWQDGSVTGEEKHQLKTEGRDAQGAAERADAPPSVDTDPVQDGADQAADMAGEALDSAQDTMQDTADAGLDTVQDVAEDANPFD